MITNQDNVILKVITQDDYDRVVFLTYEKNVLIGLNFHFDAEARHNEFIEPCERLTNIFNNLSNNLNAPEMDRVNKSIEMFCDKYIFTKDKPYSLNDNQRELIKKALDYYIATSEKFNQKPSQEEAYAIFDMMQLSPMMNYPIQVEISEEEKKNFSKHGIDFPLH